MVKVQTETYEVLERAFDVSVLSQGLFDVTVGPLVDLWDYKHAVCAPKKEKIVHALSFVDYRDVVLNRKRCMVGLQKRGQSLDLGGIGKGYAADCCIRLLRTMGVSSAFLSIGGNVSTLGNKPDGSPYKVGIRHPRKADSLIGALSVTNASVVTSGDYERYFFDKEGKRWHHIINPVSGYPADSDLVSVSVVHENSMIADALSTAMFVAGRKAGLELLLQFPQAEAILVDEQLQVYVTPRLVSQFEMAQALVCTVV